MLLVLGVIIGCPNRFKIQIGAPTLIVMVKLYLLLFFLEKFCINNAKKKKKESTRISHHPKEGLASYPQD